MRDPKTEESAEHGVQGDECLKGEKGNGQDPTIEIETVFEAAR
jgi:hypothetical protein